jgi:hypothetical protein
MLSVQPSFQRQSLNSKPEVPPFGWDQDREHLELYILVKGTLNAWGDSWKEHIQLHCSQRSVRITITDLFGKNMELLLDGLYEEIATKPTKFQPKKDSVYLKFAKVLFVCFRLVVFQKEINQLCRSEQM